MYISQKKKKKEKDYFTCIKYQEMKNIFFFKKKKIKLKFNNIKNI